MAYLTWTSYDSNAPCSLSLSVGRVSREPGARVQRLGKTRYASSRLTPHSSSSLTSISLNALIDDKPPFLAVHCDELLSFIYLLLALDTRNGNPFVFNYLPFAPHGLPRLPATPSILLRASRPIRKRTKEESRAEVSRQGRDFNGVYLFDFRRVWRIPVAHASAS